jgi:hypothetical protein
MDKELEKARGALREFGSKELAAQLGCSIAKAKAKIREWKAAGDIENKPGENYVYAWSSPDAEGLSENRQTVAQMPASGASWPLVLVIVLLCMGLAGASAYLYAQSRARLAATAIPIPTLKPQPTPTASPTPAGPRLSRAVVACWQPGGSECLALDDNTPYTALQRQGEYIRVGLPGGGLVWVDAADLAGVPGDLAEVPIPTPTNMPTVVPPAPREIVVYQPVPVAPVQQPAAAPPAVIPQAAPQPAAPAAATPVPPAPREAQRNGANSGILAEEAPRRARDQDGDGLADGWSWKTGEER